MYIVSFRFDWRCDSKFEIDVFFANVEVGRARAKPLIVLMM